MIFSESVGSRALLSAKESCKPQDLQDFLFLCFGSPPFWGIKNFCGSYNIVVFLTICISYANNCFTL